MKNILQVYKLQLWIIIWVFSYLFIFLNIYYYLNQLESKYFKSIVNEEKHFFISSETNYEELLKQLKDSFDIPNNVFFNTYAKQKNLSRFKSGTYKLEIGYSLDDIINLIRSRESMEHKGVWFTFSASDNFTLLASDFYENFINTLDSTSLVSAIYNYDYSNHGIDVQSDSNFVKAFFLPDSYRLNTNCTQEDFIKRMLKEYNKYWDESKKNKAQIVGLTNFEVSVLASIVYKEASHEFEYDTIASLYLNRLSQGIKLQADPTVNYAFKERYGFDKNLNRVYDKHTLIESDYNTYVNKGLPPSPICVPSKQSIEAVLKNVNHNYLYMCAKVEIDEVNNYIIFDKTHLFEEQYKYHKKNANKYQSALNKIEKDNSREKKGKERKYKVCYNHYYHTDLDCLTKKEK